MQVKILLTLFLICLASCKTKNREIPQEKFDKAKWAIKKDGEYQYRDNMLKDLIVHYELHGLKRVEIEGLLGKPDRTDSAYLFYTISREHLAGLPVPLHTKTLVIKFNRDSTVEWRKIHQ